ncbi:uncharacterized protein N7500_001554 [Penicillium coprophilum]|uniref:uncharacterized protein n=1 Tax=Penicillium coprophilum TaxID=36646 RepID=UPI00238AE218|nr:uncharacterized protein N7500_001554 [Penicillium coprophilum]KAJ5173623.1 hypothetical protein N7500_001554 [Penicillium coprophilum]
MASNCVRNVLINTLQAGAIPNHVAFIMDGNRRYSKIHGMTIAEGLFRGSQAMTKTVEGCFMLGIPVVTVYTFSIENFKRPKEQIEPVMEVLKDLFIEYAQPGGLLERYQCSIKVLGRLDLLGDDIKETIDIVVKRSCRQTTRFLNVYLAYTSRNEIARAVRVSAEECCRGKISPSDITAQSLARRMYAVDDPPVDILVRTSGVHRMSDFLLWQCHRDTDIQFVDPLWPEFGICDLFFVIVRWQRSKRRVELHTPNIGVLLTCFICVVMSLLPLFYFL